MRREKQNTSKTTNTGFVPTNEIAIAKMKKIFMVLKPHAVKTKLLIFMHYCEKGININI